MSLLLCDDATIQALNRDHRGEDAPTDVLSFPQEEGPALPWGMTDDALPHLLGDVVISIETARRQADTVGWSLQHEVEALLVHGLLHLIGYDHTDEDDRAVMRDHETALLGPNSIWEHANRRLAADAPPIAGMEA